MRRWLALLVLLLAPAAVGQCVLDACSDDTLGVLDNQQLSWDASEGATHYDVRVCPDCEACDTGIPGLTYYILGSPCDDPNRGDGFQVRACDTDLCSSWSSDAVEILPYACLRADGQCEYPCAAGAPLRLSIKYPEC